MPDVGGPLAGVRVGVTASRKVEEQTALLERRGAVVTWAPALALGLGRLDDAELLAVTERVIARPVDVFVANTGIGLRAWFAALDEWGRLDDVLEVLRPAEILARGPKSVGALRRRGLRESWTAPHEEIAELVGHLAARDVAGRRIVVQEHGQPLTDVVAALRARGADVEELTIYRSGAVADDAPLRRLAAGVASREVDAVTFTAAPAVRAFLETADDDGLLGDVLDALHTGVLACCVGPVTAAVLEDVAVPCVVPERPRLAAMVKELERAIAERRGSPS